MGGSDNVGEFVLTAEAARAGRRTPVGASTPDDPVLAYLAAALDEGAMAAVFRDVLRASGTDLVACRIENVDYRPRRTCLVSYVLNLADAQGPFEQRVTARVCANGEAARRAEKATLRPLRASRAGPVMVHLAPLDMVAMWWPNDARLDAPGLFSDEHLLRGAVFPGVLAALDTPAGRLASHAIDVVRYRPETSLSARVALAWRNAGGARRHQVLFAKADADNRGARAHAVLRALEASAAWRAGELCTPQSVLWQEAFGLRWETFVEGQALGELHPQVNAPIAGQVGLRLAALHAVAVPLQRQVTLAQLKKRPHELAASLGEVERSWMQPLLRVALRLERDAGTVESGAPVTLLGAVHPAGMRLDAQQRVCFTDLEHVQRGPAALDLGAWIADTLCRSVLEGDPPQLATRAWQSFLAGYAAGGGDYVPEPVLAWATAYQLCETAWRGVTRLEPGRLALTKHLIALAEAIAQAGTPRAAEGSGGELGERRQAV
jgi:hypothetical protein